VSAELARLFDGVPWALPGVLLVAVTAVVLARPVARRLGDPPLTAWALLASLGWILVITLTPSPDVPDAAGCDLRFRRLTLDLLFAVNDRSMNVLLFVPLGLAIAGLRPRHRLAWVVVAFALPPAIELVQLALTPLQRTCQVNDIADNWLGLVIGLAIGAVASWAWRHGVRHQLHDGPPSIPPM
jgi:VanZ like protein